MFQLHCEHQTGRHWLYKARTKHIKISCQSMALLVSLVSFSSFFLSFVNSLRLRCVSSIQSEESISNQNSIDNPPLALEHHRFSSLVLAVNVDWRQKWKEWEAERKCERANENWQAHVFVVILMSLICSLLSSLIDQKEITTFRGVNSWNFSSPNRSPGTAKSLTRLDEGEQHRGPVRSFTKRLMLWI